MKTKTLKPPDPPKNISADFMTGNTRIIISDDFCKSKEETDRIIERLCEWALPRLSESAFKTIQNEEVYTYAST